MLIPARKLTQKNTSGHGRTKEGEKAKRRIQNELHQGSGSRSSQFIARVIARVCLGQINPNQNTITFIYGLSLRENDFVWARLLGLYSSQHHTLAVIPRECIWFVQAL